MPKRSADLNPGDGHQPYSNIGGVWARHAQTHNVRREQLTKPQGSDRSGDELADDVAPATPTQELRIHSDEELRRLPVLETGTRLEQGGTYLDLNDRARGPFTVLGAREATTDRRYVAKKDVGYELWNRLVGAANAPATEQTEATNQVLSDRRVTAVLREPWNCPPSGAVKVARVRPEGVAAVQRRRHERGGRCP